MALINCPECNKEISDKAGACPSCGHPMEKPILVAPSAAPFSHDPNKKMCPSCKSENTQMIKMMCLNGTTSGTSTAVGVTTSLDVGVATIGSRSQTNLAAQYNPGIRPSTGAGCGLFLLVVGGFNILIGLVILIQGSPGVSLFELLVGIPCSIYGFSLYSGKSQNAKIEAWEQKNKLFETGWICHKCGHTWIP